MTEPGSDGFEETEAELQGAHLDIEAKSDLRGRWEARQADLISHSADFSADSVVALVERGDLD